MFFAPVRRNGSIVSCHNQRLWTACTSLPYNRAVFTFVETPLFTRLIQEYLSDGEYMELQSALAENPEAGRIIKGSGGIRKLRWAVSGKGKRGGLRIIY